MKNHRSSGKKTTTRNYQKETTNNTMMMNVYIRNVCILVLAFCITYLKKYFISQCITFIIYELIEKICVINYIFVSTKLLKLVISKAFYTCSSVYCPNCLCEWLHFLIFLTGNNIIHSKCQRHVTQVSAHQVKRAYLNPLTPPTSVIARVKPRYDWLSSL